MNSQSNPERENHLEESGSPDFGLYYKAIVIKQYVPGTKIKIQANGME